MSPKKVNAEYRANKKQKLITIELKKEIIKKHGREVHVMGLACQYDPNMSMMCIFFV